MRLLVAQISGASAAAGGVAWSAAAIHRSTLPRGCVGAECLLRSMRPTDPLEVLLGGLAVACLGLAALGLLVMIRRSATFGGLARAAVILGSLSLLATIAAAVLARVRPDAEWRPLVVLPAAGLGVLAMLALAGALLHAHLLPSWIPAGLLVGAGLLPAANEQTAAVLFAVPLGLAWTALGFALWSRSHSRAAARAVR